MELATSGGTFEALTFGDPAARPLLYLHGFPDHPPTAAPFLTLLGRHHRVVAPWLRGYAPSPLAGPFDVATLARDVIEIIDQLGGCVDLVGHDWGAVITYAVAALAPERVRRAVTLAVPHPLSFVRSLATTRQAAYSWYMAAVSLPGAARLVRANDLAFVDRLWRTWSPRYRLDEARRRALHACLAASLPGPLGYYRALPQSIALARRFATSRLAPAILQLHGAEDGCIVPPSGRDAHRFARRELTIVPGAGHFLQHEQPAAIAARVVAWLA